MQYWVLGLQCPIQTHAVALTMLLNNFLERKKKLPQLFYLVRTTNFSNFNENLPQISSYL